MRPYKSLILLDAPEPRPKTRGECENGLRPCPWISCRHHTALSKHVPQEQAGPSPRLIRAEMSDDEIVDVLLSMETTCSLDVAERGGITGEEVGEILGHTRERIRQLEVRGLLKFKARAERFGIDPPGGEEE